MVAQTAAAPYDPEREDDPLIRTYVEEDPLTGEAVFRGTWYPVWAVVLNLRATGYDWERVHRMFSELPREALEAAERFWQRHPDEIRQYLE